MTERSFSRIRDLPERERHPFRLFLARIAACAPRLPGVDASEQDGYWPADHAAWVDLGRPGMT